MGGLAGDFFLAVSISAPHKVIACSACIGVRPASTNIAISMCALKPQVPIDGSSVPPMILPPRSTQRLVNSWDKRKASLNSCRSLGARFASGTGFS